MFEVFSRRLLLSDQAARAQTPADARRAAKAWAQRVAGGHRPELPAGWPAALRDLIADCWAQDAARRPPLPEVVDRLRALKDAGADAAAAAAAAAAVTAPAVTPEPAAAPAPTPSPAVAATPPASRRCAAAAAAADGAAAAGAAGGGGPAASPLVPRQLAVASPRG